MFASEKQQLDALNLLVIGLMSNLSEKELMALESFINSHNSCQLLGLEEDAHPQEAVHLERVRERARAYLSEATRWKKGWPQ